MSDSNDSQSLSENDEDEGTTSTKQTDSDVGSELKKRINVLDDISRLKDIRKYCEKTSARIIERLLSKETGDNTKLDYTSSHLSKVAEPSEEWNLSNYENMSDSMREKLLEKAVDVLLTENANANLKMSPSKISKNISTENSK